MSIMEYNGGAVVAMKGEKCVAIASDLRFGMQALTMTMDFPKVFPVTEKTYIGLAGLASDAQTLIDRFRFKTNMYKLREERHIRPRTFAHMVSSTLYERRFGPYFVEPVIAGLDHQDGDEPFICSMDLIGCINFAKDFVVSGTPSNNLYGMCESLWEPGLGPDDLFETCAQALVNAFDRDALSGWGATVHVITPDSVISKTLKGRQD